MPEKRTVQFGGNELIVRAASGASFNLTEKKELCGIADPIVRIFHAYRETKSMQTLGEANRKLEQWIYESFGWCRLIHTCSVLGNRIRFSCNFKPPNSRLFIKLVIYWVPLKLL